MKIKSYTRPYMLVETGTAHWLKVLFVGCILFYSLACADTVREQASETVTVEGVAAEEAREPAAKDAMEAVARLKPTGPAPAWGKSITDPMLLVIEELGQLQSGPPMHQLSPIQARKVATPADAVNTLIEETNLPKPETMVDTTGKTIPVDRGNIHARVYTPKSAGTSNPGIVYYHGGGWVIGGIDAYDATARSLAEQTGAVVVAVAYRKAPEHKFPTAHNDAFAAYKWVVNNAASLKIDPGKIAVAGESAGGNLAANVSIMARDNQEKMPVHQLLVYPVASFDMNTESYEQYAEAKPLSKAGMNWFFDKYLRSPKDGQDPRISLVNTGNLKSLPPATIINAQIDPLTTEGKLYAQKLKAAGVPVNEKVYEGVTHEFFGMSAVLPQARDAQAMAAGDLKKSFGI